MRIATLALAGLLVATGAQAERLTDQPLVDPSWLKGHLENPSLAVVDVRTEAEGGGAAGFAQGHVPGAVFADYGAAGWRTTVNDVPGQLPPVENLEALIGKLGVDNDDHVVIVPAGQNASDFGNATRVYWTFKVLGHDAVSILDGGWRAWTADPSNPVETGAVEQQAATFTADFRPELLASAEDVEKARQNGAALIDARPADQFAGKSASPVVKAAGTIPGAVNIENSRLYDEKTGAFAAKDTIAALLESAGVKDDDEMVAFCNTGHWASVAWFGLSEVLGKETKLYDGSMAEWTRDPSRPVVKAAQ